ncbi:SDR family NAD(P)-dependent oxidoreductase [Priestia megaterium]
MENIGTFDFSQKNIFITGAASDIAISIIENFSSAGGNIILSDISENSLKLEKIQRIISDKYQNSVDIINIDLTQIEDIKNKINNYNQKIDILINCAGNNHFIPALKVNEDIWNRIIDVNLKGTFFLTQTIASKMIEDKVEGKIISIGSQHGVVANGLRAPYCISKFGLVGLTKVLALELSPHNILVNCISPTYVKTTKSKEFLEDINVQKAYLSKIPLKRYALPKDIAYSVLFLSSDNNAMITGENILIDGGYTVH